jgi:hypothetical protein
MQSSAKAALSLVLAYISIVIASRVQAQEVRSTFDLETVECPRWLEAVISKSDLDDPARFCSGIIENGSPVGWSSSGDCPRTLGRVAETTPRFCASVGRKDWDTTLAVGVIATSMKGREFLDGTLPDHKDVNYGAATLYTRTAIWIGDVHVPAGMYSLHVSQSPEELKLEVSKQMGEWKPEDDAPPYLGSAEVKRVPIKGLPMPWLRLEFWPTVWDGPVSPAEAHVQDLHFIWGDTNLYVRIRPGEIGERTGTVRKR